MLNLKTVTTAIVAIVVLTGNRNAYSQNVKVEYSMEIKINQLSPELQQKVAADLKKPLYYTLENNRLESIYYLGKWDSRKDTSQTITSTQNNRREHTTNITETRLSSTTIYKNFENNTILTRTEVDNKAYLTQAEVKEQPWKIEKETAVIAGMECRRATRTLERTGEEMEAWFAPEISVPDGPGVNYGLPGLILKVESSNNIIYATRVSYPEALNIIKPRGELITRDELTKIQAKVREESRKEPETTEQRDGHTVIRKTTRGEAIKLN